MDDNRRGLAADHYDVIALVASAGGHAAVAEVLRGLPRGFSVPIIVVQHLGPRSTSTTDVYRRLVPMPFKSIQPGSCLTPDAVLVAPPRVFVELLPDGTCGLRPCARGSLDKPLDVFLDSVARSFGQHAIAVVLSGMADDGAAGARQLHLAGGRVLVQSETSAQHPDMPRAAIKAGAADMVVPLADLGQVLGEIVAGTPRPRAASELDAIARVFGEHGEVSKQARKIDWSQNPLGPVLNWPDELRIIVRTAMDSPYMMAVWWGKQLTQLYNDAWRQLPGITRHPQALGGRAQDTWPEHWDDIIQPMVERVLMRGEVASGESLPLLIDRHGLLEEAFVTFAYAPLRDARGAVVGVRTMGWDVTRNVTAERRMRALRDLAARSSGATTPREACELAAAALSSAPADLPFALVYQLDHTLRQATLAGATGLQGGAAAAPRVIDLSAADQGTWPLSRALERAAVVDDLSQRFPGLAPATGTQRGTLAPRAAMLLPLRPTIERPPVAVLVAGLNPHCPLDEHYQGFLDLVAQELNAGLLEARSRQLERERLERLAELDRAKTEFFADVSHEFRTPLTLLLAPLEELRTRRDDLPAELAHDVDVATHNARRLLGLVNNLLDFSEFEVRRQRAPLEPSDLCGVTADVASAFRSAIEAAGLRFRVECDPRLPPVPVNREMWERIVSNLLSNAFKFTFEGEISLILRARNLHAELVLADTGVGIPASELPHIFKRFHRVRGARARTAEGSGIGLALVDDLLKRMGGQIRVHSTEGQGTTFTLWMPFKSFRQPTVPSGTTLAAPAPVRVAADLAKEASRWLTGGDDQRQAPEGVAADLLGPPAQEGLDEGAAPRGRIVVADDNSDLRDYLRRLFAPHWDVEVAPDGQAALEAVRRRRPDVVLADVMMPNLDGFGLLERIRGDPELRYTPVVLVTARVGEAAAIQGLLSGADDYITKPFSPRELAARIRAVVDRARGETALRDSERRLRATQNAVGVGIQELDAAGRSLRVNETFTRMSGWTLADMAGRAFFGTITDPADRKAVRRRYAQLVLGTLDSFTEERTCVTKDGRQVWIETRITAVRDEAGRFLHAVRAIHDATQRRNAEEALRASELKYRALIQSMDEGFVLVQVVCDAEGRPVDALYLEGNPAASRLTGVRDYNRRLWSEVAPGAEPYWLEIYERVARTGVSERREDFAAPLGRWYDFFLTPALDPSDARPERPLRVAVVFQDITARKRAEEALRLSEARQAFLLELSDAIRFLTEPAEIRAAASRILGEHLRVQRAFYAEVDGGDWVITSAYEHGVEPQAEGRHPMAAFGQWIIDDFREGWRLVIRDLHADARFTPSQRAAHEGYRILGAVAVPLVKKGTLVAILVVHSVVPRDWSDHEVSLVEETAERTWAAVERARAEAALRASEERFRLAEEAANGFIYDWTPDALGAPRGHGVSSATRRVRVREVLEGLRVTCSEGFTAMLGYPRDEVPRTRAGWAALLHPDDRKRVAAEYEQGVRAGRYAVEYRMRHKDGRYLDVLDRGSPIHQERGRVRRIIGSVVDVTERPRAEPAGDAS